MPRAASPMRLRAQLPSSGCSGGTPARSMPASSSSSCSSRASVKALSACLVTLPDHRAQTPIAAVLAFLASTANMSGLSTPRRSMSSVRRVRSATYNSCAPLTISSARASHLSPTG